MVKYIGNNVKLFERDDTYTLKGICMLLIVVHHLYQWTASRYGVHYLLPASIVLQIMGNLGSSVFFLLSGYGLSLSLWKKGVTAKDSLRRLLKLYLPFVYFWIVGGGIIMIFESEPLSCKLLLGLVTFDLPIVGGGRWFIVSIFVLYIFMMLLSKYVMDRKILSVVLFITISIYIILQIFLIQFSQVWYNTILAFPIGVLFAAYKDSIHFLSSNKVVVLMSIAFLSTFILLQLCGTSHYWPTDNTYIFKPLLMNLTCLIFSILTVSLVSRINIRKHSICFLFLKYVGINSYCFFIGHLVLVTFADTINNVFVYVGFVLIGSWLLTETYNGLEKYYINNK